MGVCAAAARSFATNAPFPFDQDTTVSSVGDKHNKMQLFDLPGRVPALLLLIYMCQAFCKVPVRGQLYLYLHLEL